jgi:predicted Zn-dependent protease
MFRKFNACRVLVVSILILAFPAMSWTQVLYFENVSDSPRVIPVQQITGDEADYFDASIDSRVKQALANAERYHMGQSVIESIAKGRYKEALPDIDFVLRYFPNHPMGLQLLTSIAVLSKNRALPIQYFEKAIALYPKHAITYAQYGWYYVTIDRVDIGIRKLQDAIELDRQLTAAYIWLAHAYDKKGQSQLAREAAARARELGYNGALPGDSKN